MSGRETEAQQREVDRRDKHQISRIRTPFAIKDITVPSYTRLVSMTEECKEVRLTSFDVGHRSGMSNLATGWGVGSFDRDTYYHRLAVGCQKLNLEETEGRREESHSSNKKNGNLLSRKWGRK